MYIQPINNNNKPLNFNGNLFVDEVRLHPKHQKAISKIKTQLTELVEGIDYCNFSIFGSTKKNHIAIQHNVEPKYMIMQTQVAPTYVPTATATTEITKPDDLIAIAKYLIKQHENSDLYKTYKADKETPFYKKAVKFIKRLFILD